MEQTESPAGAPRVAVTLTLPPDIKELTSRAARVEGTSFGVIVERALSEQFARDYGPNPLQGMAARAAETLTLPLASAGA